MKLPATLLAIALFSAVPAHAEPVDLNTATLSDLDSLPGIGRAKAQAILDERERLGGSFGSVDDLDGVKGIGKALLDKLRPHVTIGGGRRVTAPVAPRPPPRSPQVFDTPQNSTPPPDPIPAIAKAPPAPVTSPDALDAESPSGKININLASEDELQSLDGISRANARIIVAYRKVKGPFHHVAELASVPGLPAKLFQTVQYFVTARADANAVESAELVTLGFAPAAAEALVRYRAKSRFKAAKDLERVPGLSPDERVKARELLWFPR